VFQEILNVDFMVYNALMRHRRGFGAVIVGMRNWLDVMNAEATRRRQIWITFATNTELTGTRVMTISG
jgi:hypothetical protein